MDRRKYYRATISAAVWSAHGIIGLLSFFILGALAAIPHTGWVLDTLFLLSFFLVASSRLLPAGWQIYHKCRQDAAKRLREVRGRIRESEDRTKRKEFAERLVKFKLEASTLGNWIAESGESTGIEECDAKLSDLCDRIRIVARSYGFGPKAERIVDPDPSPNGILRGRKPAGGVDYAEKYARIDHLFRMERELAGAADEFCG